ncbi:hypothetical protein TeGR_g7940, partial [Tetraparma gracilis]
YSHGITMIVATKFPEATTKGKMKAALKYGALFGKNTSKDKWKASSAGSSKHSTLTKHKDMINSLALQGIKLLTPEQEKDLELDPEKGFHIEDVRDELDRGFQEGVAQAAAIRSEKEAELEQILEGRTAEIDDRTDPSDLGAVMKKAIDGRKGGAGAKPGIKKRQSAVWGLAKKSLAATKGVVAEGDNDDQIVGEDEWDELQS